MVVKVVVHTCIHQVVVEGSETVPAVVGVAEFVLHCFEVPTVAALVAACLSAALASFSFAYGANLVNYLDGLPRVTCF